ncbi:SdrD B-like domain-containing protein [Calothrix sp. PCC 6303]|uniref:SdrD B-like domain-containing protein n=1 Tax=Calothrix sp. PCC 6303 TaxID=1170562 RepID=UPI0002A04949|nr:SdrD B-like domain-containing protein [Calothrix sp. PCC 6303]AFZ02963.1 conserved repeat domain protein [Calothrix sp. PCC 6303]
MKLLFRYLQNLPTKSLKSGLMVLMFAAPQVAGIGFNQENKVLAQTQLSCPAGTIPATFNWTPSNNLADFLRQSLNAEGVGVRFEFTESTSGVIDTEESRILNSVYGGLPAPNLFFNIGPQKTPAPGGATLNITFSQPVTLASPLILMDIDRNGERDLGFIYQDRVTVTAFNNGSPVSVNTRTLGSPSTVRLTGNLAEGINENSFPDRSDGNIEVVPSGAVSQIRILYEPGQEYGTPTQDESIGVAKITICAPAGSIGDTVYNDTNSNSTQDNAEVGIGNVPVTLVGAGSDGQFGTGDDFTRTTTTDSNGKYSFTELPGGNYRVTVNTPPSGFTPTQVPNNPVTLTPGQKIDTVDFGFNQRQVGSIGDFVFSDRNRNGVADNGEVGIPNVTLILRNSSNQEIARTTTNSNGIYGFPGIPLGEYTVEAIRPGNNFNPTTRTTLPANLTQNNPNTDTIDFGFQSTGVGAEDSPNIRLLKRITGASRNGQTVTGVNFNTFTSDPNSNNDDSLNDAQRQLIRGVPNLSTPLTSGDEAEYTIYFITEGGENLQNIRFCDLIPQGTTFTNNSLTVNGAGNGGDNGRYLSPLTPVDNFSNICPANNTNGAVLVNLGVLPGGNVGFVRFRVTIN